MVYRPILFDYKNRKGEGMNKQAKEILSILKVCGYRDSELTANLLNVVDKEASTEYLNDLDEFFTNVRKHEGIAHELQVMPQGELLPCPFCMGEAAFGTMRFGCETVKQQKWEQETFHFINCIKCGANNKCLERGYATKEKAAEHWNTRYDKHNKFIEFNKWLNTVY